MKKLNIGCGNDYKKGWINLDFNKNVKADVYCNLEKKLPFEDNSFDEVYSRCVLEHMKNPFNLILEMKRVCKKGGKIIIITDNAFWIQRHEHGDATFVLNNIYKDGHYYLFHYSNLKRLFERAEIKLISGGYKEFEHFPQEKGLSPTSLKSKIFRKFQRLLFGSKRGYPHVWIEGEK